MNSTEYDVPIENRGFSGLCKCRADEEKPFSFTADMQEMYSEICVPYTTARRFREYEKKTSFLIK
ncbi:hypothetical protein C4181_16490 [Clostridioides difficile]|nr:hypothetical protein QSI_0255 [Clostridioides difficile P28]MDB3324669.1 hypothetical protein [Clostridioides difficile]